jgi:hypothetical protein
MPPALSHKKSRHGCQRCKARKVKCDEGHPVCRDCRRHNVPCEYVYTNPKGLDTTGDTQVAEKGPIGSDRNSVPFHPDHRRLLELQLLNHFTTVVSESFPSTSESETMLNLYTIYTINLSFEHPLLLNSVLALSALHLINGPRAGEARRRVSGELSALMNASYAESIFGPISAVEAHRVYLNLALEQQRDAITKLPNFKTDVLVLATIFLSFQAIGLSMEEPSIPNSYSPPVPWLRMSKGIQVIANTLAPTGNEPLLLFMSTLSTKPDFRNKEAILDPENARPFHSLLDFSTYPEPACDANTVATYQQTLAYVGSIWRGIQDSESLSVLFRRFLSMGMMIPEQFLDLIDQRRPRALAILALYCSMTISVDEHWIFHGMAERDVHGLQMLLPADWQWSMETPLQILSRKGNFRQDRRMAN